MTIDEKKEILSRKGYEASAYNNTPIEEGYALVSPEGIKVYPNSPVIRKMYLKEGYTRPVAREEDISHVLKSPEGKIFSGGSFEELVEEAYQFEEWRKSLAEQHSIKAIVLEIFACASIHPSDVITADDDMSVKITFSMKESRLRELRRLLGETE